MPKTTDKVVTQPKARVSRTITLTLPPHIVEEAVRAWVNAHYTGTGVNAYGSRYVVRYSGEGEYATIEGVDIITDSIADA